VVIKPNSVTLNASLNELYILHLLLILIMKNMELTINQAFVEGVAAHKEGKLEEAERLYRVVLKSQLMNSHVNHNLGVLALSHFKAALEANPKIE